MWVMIDSKPPVNPSLLASPHSQLRLALPKLLLCCTLLLGSSVGAAPITTIQTPPADAIATLSTATSLQALSLTNLIATNCNVADLPASDAALLAGTAQAVANHMSLSTGDYFDQYIAIALQQFSTPDACTKHAGMTRDLVEQIKALGGRVITP